MSTLKLPSIDEALRLAETMPDDLPEDFASDNGLIVLAAEVMRLRAELRETKRYLRAANRGAERNALALQASSARWLLHRKSLENHELREAARQQKAKP